MATRNSLCTRLFGSPRGRLVAVVVSFIVGVSTSFDFAFAQSSNAADDVAQAAAYQIALPVLFDGWQLPRVQTVSTPDRVLELSPADLAKSLKDQVSDETLMALREFGVGMIAVSELEALGLGASLDPATLSVLITADPSTRASSEFTLSGSRSYDGLDVLQPSDFAVGATFGFLGGVQIDDESQGASARQDGFVSVSADGFANAWGREGVNLDFGFSTTADLGDDSTIDDIARDRVTLFHDDIDREIRYSAGDISPNLPRLAGFPDFVGASIERRVGAFQPGRAVRATGDRSLFLERRATIEVVVNGVAIRRFVAGPGPVDISDIPFTETTNDVEIIVEDDLGRRTVDSFSFGSDQQLVAPGLVEFTVAAGVAREAVDEADRVSDIDVQVEGGAIGALRYGLTSQVTGQTFAAGGEQFVGGGAGAVVGTGIGIFRVDAASSVSNGDVGYAVDGSFFTDFTGPFGFLDRFSVSGEYDSMDYAQLGDLDATGLEEWRARSTVSIGVTDASSVTTGGSFRRQQDADREVDEEYEVSFGFAQRLGRLSFNALGSHVWDSDDDDEIRGFFGLSYSLGPRTAARSRYDTTSNRAVGEVARTSRDLVGDYGYRVRLEHDDDELNLLGNAEAIGNRYEAGIEAERVQDLEGEDSAIELTARFQTGFAYADGRFAVGRDPGRGFFIVDKHETLSDAKVLVRESRSLGGVVAHSDWLGPAVAPVTSSHRVEDVILSFEGVPVGYNLGEGEYLAQTGARSGFAIEVGSDANYTVIGILHFEGEPLPLKSGVAVRSNDTASTEQHVIFTNRSGRFALTGVAPGEFLLRLDGDRYFAEIAVAASDQPFVDVGTVELSRQ